MKSLTKKISLNKMTIDLLDRSILVRTTTLVMAYNNMQTSCGISNQCLTCYPPSSECKIRN